MTVSAPITFAGLSGSISLSLLDTTFADVYTNINVTNTQLGALNLSSITGTLLPSQLSTGHPSWDAGGNLSAYGLTLTTGLPVSSGGTGATNATVGLTNLLPTGESSNYVLTTSGRGTYFWGPGGGGSGGSGGSTLNTTRQQFSASAGQTVFNLSNTYTPGAGQLRVYVAGVRQYPDAYSETSTTSFTLSTGVTLGTSVFAEIDKFNTSAIAASAITNTPVSPLTATDVQGAINQLAPLAGATFTGLVTLQQTQDVFNTKTSATGTVTHDISTGLVFYHTSIAANFTANFTNVPTTANRTTVVSLILVQGATPYIPNSVQINGTAATIKWQDATVPTGKANAVDVASFNLINVSGTFTVIAGLSTYA
jgi:hypothetical protein